MEVDNMIYVVYKCKICDLEAKSIEILQKHITVHSAVIEENGSTSGLNATRKCEKLNIIHTKRKNIKQKTSLKRKMKLESVNHDKELDHNTRSSKRIASKKMRKNEEIGEDEQLSDSENEESENKDAYVQVEPRNECVKCMISFDTKTELSIHVDSHVGNKFKCVMCDYTNKTWPSVYKHMQTHNKDTTYKCDDCSGTFASFYTLENHRRFHHFGGHHKCDKCEFIATSKFLLIQHNQTVHAEMHRCEQCNFTADNKIDVLRHIQQRHKGYICKLCSTPMTYESKAELMSHCLDAHSGKSLFFCQLCNYVAKLKHHLTKHELVHNGLKPFNCDEPGCDYKTKDKKSLKRHKTNFHRKPGDLVCKTCNFVTVDQSEYDVHIAMHEVKAKEYKCQYCDFKSANSGSVRSHRIVKHTAFENMRFPCPRCNYKSNMREGLHKHLLTHVKKNELFQCNICDDISDSKEVLKQHYIDYHNEGNPLMCEKCTFVTLKPNCLKLHMLSHKSKPFACDRCKFITTTLTLLQGHVRSKHPQAQITVAITDAQESEITSSSEANQNKITPIPLPNICFSSPVPTSINANQQNISQQLNTPYLDHLTTPRPTYHTMEDPIYVVHVQPGSVQRTPLLN